MLDGVCKSLLCVLGATACSSCIQIILTRLTLRPCASDVNRGGVCLDAMTTVFLCDALRFAGLEALRRPSSALVLRSLRGTTDEPDL